MSRSIQSTLFRVRCYINATEYAVLLNEQQTVQLTHTTDKNRVQYAVREQQRDSNETAGILLN